MTRLDFTTTGARLGLTLWMILLIVVTIRVAVAPIGKQSVVPIYQIAGERFRVGESLYAAIPQLDRYRNPPGVAFIATSLTVVPPKTAGILMRLAQAAIFLTGLRRALLTFGPDWPPARIGWAFAIASVLLAPAVNNGQLNVLIAGSLLHAAAATHAKRDAEAAIWVALASSIKLYPLAVGLLLGIARPRFAPRLVVALTLGGIIPYLGQSSEVVSAQYQEYWHYLGDDDRTYAHLVRVPRDWTCLPRMFLNVVVPAKAALAVGLGMASLAALLMWRLTRRDLGTAAALVLGSTWMTAFGPATEANTYTLLAGSVPVALWLAPRTWPRRIAWVGVALLISPAIRGAFPEDWLYTVYGPQALGAVLVCGGFCWRVTSAGASSSYPASGTTPTPPCDPHFVISPHPVSHP